ncbi:pilus assembly protein Flp/PilA [Bradyrhizobium sp. USDA 4508]
MLSPMLQSYIKIAEGLRRLRTDKDGVVSFEYVIVAACIVAAVSAAFGTGTASGIGSVLTTSLTSIGTAVTSAVSA